MNNDHYALLARSAVLNIAEGDAAPSLPTRRGPRETGPTSGEAIEEPKL